MIVRDGSPNGGARRDESLRAGRGKTSMERTPGTHFAPDRGDPPVASDPLRMEVTPWPPKSKVP